MTNQPKLSTTILRSSLRTTACALALLCAWTTVAGQAAQAQTFTVLHSFSGGPDGATPYSGLVLDRAGNLYGTTQAGGNIADCGIFGSGCGTVYKLTRRGASWSFGVLYAFGGSDGANPQAPVTVGRDGNLYGTTWGGGGGSCNDNGGCGTVFKLQPPASLTCHSITCPWTETVLYAFPTADPNQGPTAPLAFDATGKLYSTLAGGSIYNPGDVYTLTPSSGSWIYDEIYGFGPLPDAEGPSTGVIFDHSDHIFGLTSGGGSGNCGTVYQLISSQSGWKDRIVHNFDCNDGQTPGAGPLVDSSDNLYGGTLFGGEFNAGVIFEVNESGGGYNLIHSFPPVNCAPDGLYPWGPSGTMSMDSSGTIYGTTVCGGIGYGSVFKLTPSGGGWQYTELYDFQGGDDGNEPTGAAIDASGNIYGATSRGGTGSACLYGCGVVWKITP